MPICVLFQQTLPLIPADNEAFVSMVNTFSKNCSLQITDSASPWTQQLQPNSSLFDDRLNNNLQLFRQSGINTNDGLMKSFIVNYTAAVNGDCDGIAIENGAMNGSFTVSRLLEGGKSYYFVFGYQGYFTDEAQWDKPTEGQGQFSMKYAELSAIDAFFFFTVST